MAGGGLPFARYIISIASLLSSKSDQNWYKFYHSIQRQLASTWRDKCWQGYWLSARFTLYVLACCHPRNKFWHQCCFTGTGYKQSNTSKSVDASSTASLLFVFRGSVLWTKCFSVSGYEHSNSLPSSSRSICCWQYWSQHNYHRWLKYFSWYGNDCHYYTRRQQ